MGGISISVAVKSLYFLETFNCCSLATKGYYKLLRATKLFYYWHIITE